MISETWLDSQVSDTEFIQDGYMVFRKDRKLHFYPKGTYVNESRGGVLMLVKNCLNPTLYEPGDCDAEILWCNITPHKNLSLLMGVAYRPEKGHIYNLERICKSINAINTDNVILMGDFNFRQIDWENGDTNCEVAQLFLDTVEDNLLTQMVDKPTRGNNILDLLLTGNTNIIEDVVVKDPFSTSDHNLVMVRVKAQIPRINLASRKVYLYSKGDYEAFSAEIKGVNWDLVLSKTSIEKKWDTFKDYYKK